MDNAFTQVLISEIENLNLRYSQYILLLDKGETEKFPEGKVPKDVITITQGIIDELKISIIQISNRIPPVKNQIKLSPEAEKRIDELQLIIRKDKVPKEIELKAYIDIINQIYAVNLTKPEIGSKTQSSKQLTG